MSKVLEEIRAECDSLCKSVFNTVREIHLPAFIGRAVTSLQVSYLLADSPFNFEKRETLGEGVLFLT